MASEQNIFKKFVTDKHGKVVIWQMPNIPLSTWFGASVMSKIMSNGKAHSLFTSIAFGALFAWALMELFTGASYFRRFLGAIVLAFMVYGKLK